METERNIHEVNHSYIFIPFKYNENTEQLTTSILATDNWEQSNCNVLYFYKYITDKMNSSNPEDCMLYQICLSSEGRKKWGVGPGGEVRTIYPKDAYNYNEEVSFYIDNILLFCFKSSIHVAAVQVSFISGDPLYVATGLYYLKTPDRYHIWYNGSDTGGSLLDFVKNCIGQERLSNAEFFFTLI